MQVLGRNFFKQFAQPIRPPLCCSHNQITVPHRQIDLRASFNSRFFRKRSRDPQSQAVAPPLDFRLHLLPHGYTLSIQLRELMVYAFYQHEPRIESILSRYRMLFSVSLMFELGGGRFLRRPLKRILNQAPYVVQFYRGESAAIK
jgi:hypothetical protein